MKKRDTWLLIALAALLLIGGGVAYVYYSQRGLRNNNPGNILLNPANDWQGQLDQAQAEAAGMTWDGTFAQFDTMQDGLRALMITLSNYVKRDGIAPTVNDLISNWSATDQATYIANVAASLGVDPNDTLTMNASTLVGLAQAITMQENGTDPIDPSIYQQAAVAAGVPA
jgi:hypothetical protein